MKHFDSLCWRNGRRKECDIDENIVVKLDERMIDNRLMLSACDF
jgi:hypothetical protein